MGKEIQKIVEEMKNIKKPLEDSLVLLKYIDHESETIEWELEIISRILKFIELPVKDYNKNAIFFEDFDVLSVFTDTGKYNDLEVYKIVKFLITKNVSMGLDRAEGIIDCRKVVNFPFENVSKKEILRFMCEDKISYMKSNYDDLTDKEKSFYNQLIANIEKLKLDELDEVQEANIVLNEYFTEKEDEYTLEDIAIAVKKLRKLKVSDKSIEAVRRVMEKRYNKRKKKENLNKTSKLSYTKSEKKYLTDAEYKILLKKIKEVYDAYNIKLKRELTKEEMMEVVSAMVEIGYEESQVNMFVKLARESFETDEIGIKAFIENYDRYLYYLGEEVVNDLLDYLEQMMITNDEDYSFWKISFLEELEKVNQNIKYKQGYEYQSIKKI